jgi:hypothetical protein
VLTLQRLLPTYGDSRYIVVWVEGMVCSQALLRVRGELAIGAEGNATHSGKVETCSIGPQQIQSRYGSDVRLQRV